MLRLFKDRTARSVEKPGPVPPQTSANSKLYVIGDIHGRVDLLDIVLSRIERDAKANADVAVTEIILGDFIDRGPDSRKVIELLATPPAGRERIVLRGNHEEVMLRFLDDPDSFKSWLPLGGFETLMSYGIKRRPIGASEDLLELWNEARDRIPSHHVDFLRSTVHYHRDGGYLFVHAGIRPGIPLDQQSAKDLLWIREPFLSFTEAFDFHVVHGHTPVEKADARPNRTNIDTAAYASHRLTCLVLRGEQMQVMSTRALD